MKYAQRRHATPSEPIAWTRIGVKSRRCRGCDRKLTLAEVAHFGTDREGSRFVECVRCFEIATQEILQRSEGVVDK